MDTSCRFIIGRYLEQRDRSLLYDFAISDNLWERRISIITCLHFIKQRDFDDALRISDILLTDTQDLIQKAVGWMLREIGKIDFDAEYAFLVEDDRYQKCLEPCYGMPSNNSNLNYAKSSCPALFNDLFYDWKADIDLFSLIFR